MYAARVTEKHAETTIKKAQPSEALRKPSERPLDHDPESLAGPKGTFSKAIMWDSYSLIIAGRRTAIFSAEFHPWRLPNPALWKDVLQRIKDAGFNTVSTYTHWGLIQSESNPASIDLKGINDLDYFLRICQQVGLFVILRPGPYINAETTAGGMAPWVVNLPDELRTNGTSWSVSFKLYLHAIAETAKIHQLSYESENRTVSGGSLIMLQAENEYHPGGKRDAYMRDIVSSLKAWGITVPISYNDADRERGFLDIVDLYGIDSYPQEFDCSRPEVWKPVKDDYNSYHEHTNPTQPLMIPEFQGGAYDPFEGSGYQACRELTNEKFIRVFVQDAWSQKKFPSFVLSFGVFSLQMVYGGTNWGAIAMPDVYTSYDYGASLTESRQLTPKHSEYRLHGIFIRSLPEFSRADLINRGEDHCVVKTWACPEKVGLSDGIGEEKKGDAAAWVSELFNSHAQTRFYVVRHTNSSDHSCVKARLRIKTLHGPMTIPQDHREGIAIAGRDSRIVVVDKTLGSGIRLRYSTASIFLAAQIGDKDVLVLYGAENEYVEGQFDSPDQLPLRVIREDDEEEISSKSKINFSRQDGGKSLAFNFRISASQARRNDPMTATKIRHGDKDLLLLIVSTDDAYAMHAPVVRYGDRDDAFGSFWDLGSNETVLVHGPPFVRNAVARLENLYLEGQTSEDTVVLILAPSKIDRVLWNGREISGIFRTKLGIFIGLLPGPSRGVIDFEPPNLENLTWKYRDSLYEVTDPAFDDWDWTEAIKTSSDNPFWKSTEISTQGWVLFADEYGYHGNNILWRGSFYDEIATGFEVRLQGGHHFAFSVWLNNVTLGSAFAGGGRSTAEKIFMFPEGALKPDGKNIITILQDSMGLNQEDGPRAIGNRKPTRKKFHEATKLPRGIISYHLVDACQSTSITWKVAGNHMGEKGPDRVRTYLNEGGLLAERKGWHLPGYDDTDWEKRSPTQAIHTTTEEGAGVGFFRVTFNLSLPEDHDVALGILFPSQGKSKGNYRAQIYVNGWQMGKRISTKGPQTYFPLQNGILNHQGENTIALSLWGFEGPKENKRLEGPLKILVEARNRGKSIDDYRLDAPSYSDLR
ncbi:hypothetical protein IE53DRAFT_319787 [Violaceomyces palustris]|uniref:Uncharacterized protein n=1 Tax=Violaceomyces palustris TaxID=1673888 RepID=A0ACD0NR22_9BASI|nr:hypothetical protein IE53DRAFT_319787 [Violaceomyces palustris]